MRSRRWSGRRPEPSILLRSVLRVRYTANVPADAPTRLILKRNISEEWAREAGAEEVKFYTLVASLADHPRLTVPCYAAAYDEDTGQSYLLLEDLSATHRPPVSREQLIGLVDAVPAATDISAVVETLAQLHAYWWDHPLLDAGQFSVGYWSRTPQRFEQYLQRRTTSWQRVIAQEGTSVARGYTSALRTGPGTSAVVLGTAAVSALSDHASPDTHPWRCLLCQLSVPKPARCGTDLSAGLAITWSRHWRL